MEEIFPDMEMGLILEYFLLSLILPQLIRLLVYFHDYKYWIPTITFMLQIHPEEIDLQLLYSFLAPTYNELGWNKHLCQGIRGGRDLQAESLTGFMYINEPDNPWL